MFLANVIPKTKYMFGFEVPYISTANWVVIGALFFFLTFISVWMILGRGILRDFLLTTFVKTDGRADEKKLTMFAIVLLFIFLLVRGSITGIWLPDYVFWGLTLTIIAWLGLSSRFALLANSASGLINKSTKSVTYEEQKIETTKPNPNVASE